jgi:hypothetical protein
MFKKMNILIIIITVLIIVAGILLYFLFSKNRFSLDESNVRIDAPVYPGSRMVFQYAKPPLYGNYYIAPAKEGEVANFYKNRLESTFEIKENKYLYNSLYFNMVNHEMLGYIQGSHEDFKKAHEKFGRGTLMSVEINQMPEPLWDYSLFNTRENREENTLFVLWFYYNSEK